MDQPVDVSS